MLQRFQTFVGGINCCYKYIQQIKSIEMAEFGLKGTHAMCLFFLNQHPQGLTAATLSQLCAEDKASVSRTVADLTARGYIAKGSAKNYRAPLKLTAEGMEAAKQLDPLIDSWVLSGGDGLTEAEREVFYRSLSRIGENLRTRLEEMEK